MSEPLPPPDRLQSDRERLQQVLSADPSSARALSQAAGLSERDVLDHLQHLQKSLKIHNRRLLVTPAACLDCQFVFQKRARLTRPGKCPVCRSTHLCEPLFSLV
jgi:predicted Zn-ribbon and HTH transcriptional regulator